MTPYAKYHLRLIEIDRRWRSLAARTKTYPNNLRLWPLAQREGILALELVQNDIEYFDAEVHSTPRREKMFLPIFTTDPRSVTR